VRGGNFYQREGKVRRACRTHKEQQLKKGLLGRQNKKGWRGGVPHEIEKRGCEGFRPKEGY